MTSIHNPDIYGPLALNGSPGSIGQIPISQGAGQQVIWGNQTALPRYYLATDKTAQAIILGPADITWNTPAPDAINGFIFTSPTQITVPANRTCKLIANLTPTVAAVAYTIQWVDNSNTPVGSLNQPANGLANLNHVHAIAFVRFAVDTIVKVRMVSAIALTLGPVCSILLETVD